MSKEGTLKKKKAGKNWKKRYVMLKDDYLYYYSDKEGKLFGELLIPGCRIEGPPKKLESKPCFTIVPPGGDKDPEYYFVADNIAEMEDWITVLEQVASKSRPQEGPGSAPPPPPHPEWVENLSHHEIDHDASNPQIEASVHIKESGRAGMFGELAEKASHKELLHHVETMDHTHIDVSDVHLTKIDRGSHLSALGGMSAHDSLKHVEIEHDGTAPHTEWAAKQPAPAPPPLPDL